MPYQQQERHQREAQQEALQEARQESLQEARQEARQGAWQEAELEPGLLWVEQPVGTPRLPDPVRTAAVRAVLIAALTIVQAMVAVLCTLADSWLAFPALLSTVVSTVVATWGVLDVWVTRQVYNQRHGVVSSPSSAARALHRERRRARRAARSAARAARRARSAGPVEGRLSRA